MYYTIRYQYGTYSGERRVRAYDADKAITRVRAEVRRESSLAMAYESYRVVASDYEYDDDDEE